MGSHAQAQNTTESAEGSLEEMESAEPFNPRQAISNLVEYQVLQEKTLFRPPVSLSSHSPLTSRVHDDRLCYARRCCKLAAWWTCRERGIEVKMTGMLFLELEGSFEVPDSFGPAMCRMLS